MTIFVSNYFNRVSQVLEDYAFFFCFFDFDVVSRHFILGSSVDVVNFLGTKSYSSSACVHCSVTTTNDCNLFTKLDFFVSYNLTEEINTADYAFCIFARAANAC